MDDKANKRNNFPAQKLVADFWQISLFNCSQSWPAHPSWTPHQKSQLLGTRSVIQQLGERGGSGGVWGKLETSGETAILRVLLVFFASLKFLLSFCLSLSNEEDRGSMYNFYKIWNLRFFSVLNFEFLVDTCWLIKYLRWCSLDKICVQIMEPQHWVEHQCIAITYLFLTTYWKFEQLEPY